MTITTIPARGEGLFQAPGNSHGEFPPHGKLLAVYTDGEGYFVDMIGGAPDALIEGRAYATMHITSPKGKTVQAGYFQNRPEKEWELTREEWGATSWEERAAMEVTQQATAYEPLYEQFEVYRQEINKIEAGIWFCRKCRQLEYCCKCKDPDAIEPIVSYAMRREHHQRTTHFLIGSKQQVYLGTLNRQRQRRQL